MPAIITDPFKKFVIQHLYDDVFDSAQPYYYIGIGRSQDWDSADTVVAPTRSLREERNFRLNLQSVKRTELVTFVVPRYNWVAGTIYSGYDDAAVGIPSNTYYILTDNNSVYMCLQQGKDATGAAVPSVNKPSSVSTAPFKTSDGYVWKFLYTISGLKASRYLTANYMPVQLQDATDSSSTAIEIEQYNVQQAAVPGSISSIKVTSGGTGYVSPPTVSIVGNGSGARASATVAGGTIVKIDIDDSAGTFLMGSGYDYASVVITGTGTGASARAILSSQDGFGFDPRIDLKSSGIMFNARLEGAENNDFIIGQDFRQIGLMKGLKHAGTDSDYTASTGSALQKIALSSIASSFTEDRIIQGAVSGAKAYVDRYEDGTKNIIYFHQTEETGFTPFSNGESVTEINGSGAGVIDSASLGDINIWSGDIHYIENRAAVERDAASIEDVKIVIQL